MKRLIYYGASWFGQSKVLIPQVMKWCECEFVEFVYKDVDEWEDECKDKCIVSIPTLILQDEEGNDIARGFGFDGFNHIKSL